MKNKLMKAVEGFTVLTSVSCLDCMTDDDIEKLTNEQYQILCDNGINWDTGIGVHFIGCTRNNKALCLKFWDIDEPIQYLDIKEGCDLVRFQNGNIGYVAYYGNRLTGLEIIHIFEN